MTKRNKKPRDRRGPPKGQPITQEVLKQHADVLVRIWLLLKKEKPELTSDEFWKLLKKRWFTEGLRGALKRFSQRASYKDFLDLFRETPLVTNKIDGTFLDDGETWITKRAAAKKIGRSKQVIGNRLSRCRSRSGRNASGRECVFYALSDVMRACADLCQNLPSASKEGLFEHQKDLYGSIRGLSRKLNVPRDDVKHVIGSCRSLQGYDGMGRVTIFYSLSDVKNACAKRIAFKTKTDQHGLLRTDDGDVRGTIRGVAKVLGVSTPKIKDRALSLCVGYPGRDYSNRDVLLYSVNEVSAVLAGLRTLKPKGYWKNRENFDRELQEWIRKHGFFPSQADLADSGCSSIGHFARYHGGLTAIRVRMGYGPVTQDLLVANADDLAQVYLQLKKLRVKTTSGELWHVIKARWCEQDLRKAIEAFKKRKSLTAFKKLLA